MFTMNIDNEVLDEVEGLFEAEGEDTLVKWLFGHTTDFVSVAFITDAVLKAIDEARKKLNEE